MNPSIASAICWCGILGLFYLNRDDKVRTSKALWLPVIYLWIIGSRAPSMWLGIAPAAGANVQLEGSPFDAAIFGILLLGAIAVLIQRGRSTRRLLAANWPIVIYFVYCLVSVAWSSHADVAFKRWIKSIDDVAMVLLVVSDPQPVAAMKRLISRVGFVLLPTSVLLIKYYDDLGHAYTPVGGQMDTGVTTDKNMLGLMLLVVLLCTFWHVITLLRAGKNRGRRRRLAAQITLLVFGVSLLGMAQCDTAIACSILGGILILACESKMLKRRPGRIHALCLSIFVAGGLALMLGGSSDVAHAMGRSSNFSGRTEIWSAVISAAHNPITGAGFESFWISDGAPRVWHTLEAEGWDPLVSHLNEAHDGYIEVYLNLGLVGVFIIASLLISGYRYAVAEFRKSTAMGGLLFAYIIAAAFYNITEAGFRSLDLMWIFLLLSVVSASGIAAEVVHTAPQAGSRLRGRSRGEAGQQKQVSSEVLAYAARLGAGAREGGVASGLAGSAT